MGKNASFWLTIYFRNLSSRRSLRVLWTHWPLTLWRWRSMCEIMSAPVSHLDDENLLCLLL